MDFPYSFLGNIPLTGSITLLDMVIQTRPLFADILGQAAAAASYMEQLVNQVYRVPDSLRAW